MIQIYCVKQSEKIQPTTRLVTGILAAHSILDHLLDTKIYCPFVLRYACQILLERRKKTFISLIFIHNTQCLTIRHVNRISTIFIVWNGKTQKYSVKSCILGIPEYWIVGHSVICPDDTIRIFYILQDTVVHFHHWREGNLPSSSKCSVCKKTCWSGDCLTGYRCDWCGLTVWDVSLLPALFI